LSGGRLVWVEMSRGRFVGGRIVKAPKILREEPREVRGWPEKG
jgi:hypothetical protein